MQQQNDMQHLPLSQIHRSETLNPRRHRNAAKFEEMIESVRENGVIQPIVVRPSPTLEGMYEVVAGDTRFEASQKVSMDTIPASIRHLTDAEAKLLAATENLQRADLSPIEEAYIAVDVMEANHQNHEDARKELGWSRSKLDTRLLLSHCIDDVSKAMIDGEIKIGHAEIMASLSNENQKHVLKRILDEGMSVDEARQRMKSITPALRWAPFDKADCQTCRHNSSSNADLFASTDEEDKAVCYHKPCFDQKTTEACQIIATDARESFGRVHMDTEITESGYTVIEGSNENGNGVGAEQAAACAGCEHFGAIVRTGYGRAGKLVTNACFNLTCHAEKKQAYQEAISEVPMDTQSSDKTKSSQLSASEPNGAASTAGNSTKGTANKKDSKAAPETLRKGVKKLAFARFACAAQETLKNNPDMALAISLLELIKAVKRQCADAQSKLATVLESYAEGDTTISSAASYSPSLDKPETIIAFAALGTRTLSYVMVDVAALMSYRDDSADHFEKSQAGKTNLTILRECKTHTAEWVVVDKAYLDAQTKGVIVKDAKDSGFAEAYDTKNGEGAFTDLAKGKVTDLKKAILEFEDFDWQGYEPHGFKLTDYVSDTGTPEAESSEAEPAHTQQTEGDGQGQEPPHTPKGGTTGGQYQAA